MKNILILLLGFLLLSPAFAVININTANETELQTLSGIGPSKAKAIVEYRKENGNFKTTTDIKNVKGIGDGIFKKIESEISTNGANSAATKAAPKPATTAKAPTPQAKPASK